MKPMTLATASLSLLLAACTAAQAPAAPEAPSASQATTAPAAAPATAQQPMAKRAAGDQGPPMSIFRAFGTEPFWNVNVVGDQLTFTTPEDQAGVVMQGERRMLEGGVEINGSVDGQAFMLSVRPAACSNGMSDYEYTLVSTFRYGKQEFTGCGEVAKWRSEVPWVAWPALTSVRRHAASPTA